MNHSIVKDKWNAKDTNGDTVYILGDLAMRGTQEDLIVRGRSFEGV